MDNLEEIATTGRVTRSLRKRLTSVDSSEPGSRPTTPLPPKLPFIAELNSPSHSARMTRRNSTTGHSTPAKPKTSASVETTIDAACTPARRSTRKRSTSISEDTPGKVVGKSNVAQPKFDTLPEEDTKSSADASNSHKRFTRGQSKSPLQQELEKTVSSSSKVRRPYKPAPKSKMLRRQNYDSDSDLEILDLTQTNEDDKKPVKNEKSITEKTIPKQTESPKLRTEQLVKDSAQSPKGSPLKRSLKKTGNVSLSKADEQQDSVIQLLDDTLGAEENKKTSDIITGVDPKEALDKKDERQSIDHAKHTPERSSNDIKKKQTPTKNVATPTTSPKRPLQVVEVVRLCRISPQKMVKLLASDNSFEKSPTKSNRSSPVKSKSVTFNGSNADDSAVKGTYPRTPGLAKSKSYIDIDSSKEVNDGSFQSDHASIASFKDASERPASGRSSKADVSDHSKESLEHDDATNEHEEQEPTDDIDTLVLENKTPYKSKLLVEHTSSTPLVEAEVKNEKMLKRASMETVGEKSITNNDMDLLDKSLRSGKKYGDSPTSQKPVNKMNNSESEDTTPKKVMSAAVSPQSVCQEKYQNISTPIVQASKAGELTPTDDKKVTSTVDELDDGNTSKAIVPYFATSWSQGISVQANNNSKIDAISIKVTPNKLAAEKTPETKAKSPGKPENVDAINEDDESEEEKAPSYEKVWFVDDEAIEANEDYCSGDSLTAEERQEIEENKIEVDGESIGSVDTVELMVDEESDNENASFVTSETEDEASEFTYDDEHFYTKTFWNSSKDAEANASDDSLATTLSYKLIKNVSNSSNDAEANATDGNAEKVNKHNTLNASSDGAALSLDVSKMIDETLNGGELMAADENVEKKKQRRSSGSSIKKLSAGEGKGETVDLNNSSVEKRKSLNKSTAEAKTHNKSIDKIASDNSPTNKPTQAESEHSKISDKLKSSSAMKDLVSTSDMDVIVIKRTSIEGKQSPKHPRRSGHAASKAAVKSSSEDEKEEQHKSMNSSQKLNAGSAKKDQPKPAVTSSSSDEEEDELPACQSLRMQRAEVYESSDEDEVVGNSLNSSVKSCKNSLNSSKPNGADAVSASAEKNSRKSLNSSQQANGKNSQTDQRLSNSSPKSGMNKNNSSSSVGDKSLNKSTAEPNKHNKSVDKIATDTFSANKPTQKFAESDFLLLNEPESEDSDNMEVADETLSKKICDKLKSSSALKDLVDTSDMDVIVIKRKPIEGNQSPSNKKAEHTRQSGFAASKAAVTSSSEDEEEKQHKSLNSSQKRNDSKNNQYKLAITSSSSDDEGDELPACQSLRMQRAEVYESSDEDEVVGNSLNSSVKSRKISLNSSKPNGADAVSSSTEKNSRKSLNSTQQAYGKNSQTDQRLSNSSQKTGMNKNNSGGCDDGVEQVPARKSLRQQRPEVDESTTGKAVAAAESDKRKTKLSAHERSIAAANTDDVETSEDSTDESECDSDEKSKSSRRSAHNGTQKTTTEDSAESDDSEDSDDEYNDKEEMNLSLKPRKSAAGLSVSFGQIKKEKKHDVLSGKIKHSSFTIGVTVTKNAANMSQQSASTAAEEDSTEQPSSTDAKKRSLSSDEKQRLEILARTERTSNISTSKRRQSLALPQTAVASPLPKKTNRKSSFHSREENHPSQSFIESIDERKRVREEEQESKRRRISKSFCEATTVGAKDHDNELIELSLSSKENVNATTVTGEMRSTSTPRAGIAAKEGKNLREDILGRCDEILEAANQAKLESKRNYQKSKVSLPKKKKFPKEKNVEEGFESSVSKNETKVQEKTKKALEQALKASANILLKPKKGNLTAQVDKNVSESKRLPMQLLEAVANTDPKSFKKRNKDSPLKSDNKMTLHSTHKVKSTSGYVIEEALTPPGKKKAPINKFELPSGVVYEEPITPKREKSVSGFRESPVTPRTIGFKVRRMLMAGQDTPPTMPTKQQSRKERKRKHAIQEPKWTLPKPKWTKSGEFYEEEVLPTAHKVSRIGATEFLVSALNGARKEKGQHLMAGTACSSALNFKKIAMQRNNPQRESSHEVLLRKERQRIHSNF